MDTKIYTQDKAKAAEQAGVRIDKTFAMPDVMRQPTPEAKQAESDKTRSRDNDYGL
jgi:hypothetical protein